jgi:hypothetical protein
MNKVPNQAWWSSMGFPKPEPTRDEDFADMGTAFGLDASMAPASETAANESASQQRFNDRLNGRSVI